MKFYYRINRVNPLNASVFSYRNQSVELESKSMTDSVLLSKKYVSALLLRTKIYKITLCPHDKFS